MSWIIVHNGKSWQVDYCGFLYGKSYWLELDEDWIDYVRIQVGIPEITPAHREVIECVNQYYRKHGISPMARTLCSECNKTLRELYQLFPDLGIIPIMAGLPCSTCYERPSPLGSSWHYNNEGAVAPNIRDMLWWMIKKAIAR